MDVIELDFFFLINSFYDTYLTSLLFLKPGTTSVMVAPLAYLISSLNPLQRPAPRPVPGGAPPPDFEVASAGHTDRCLSTYFHPPLR